MRPPGTVLFERSRRPMTIPNLSTRDEHPLSLFPDVTEEAPI